MSTAERQFSSFRIGDLVTFRRSFRRDEFEAFSALSGDRNPLHHDPSYAAESAFGDLIVPLHMTLAPLSMIAGMVFPGESSLYLGHEVRAAKPVSYDDELHYSARLTAVNEATRSLGIRVLAVRDVEVVLDAVMRVRSEKCSWSTPAGLTIVSADAPRRALITGASGEIGSALALLLARRGWNLLLQIRSPAKVAKLREQLTNLPQAGEIDFIEADLATAEGRSALAASAARRDDIALVIHVASPEIEADLEALVSVNYAALREVVQGVLPGMLSRQYGRIVHVGSIAMERSIPGWENYSAAKAMTAQFVTAFGRRYGPYGLHGFVALPGFVATSYSQAFRGSEPAMLPEELADRILEHALLEGAIAAAATFEAGAVASGAIGFHAPARERNPAAIQLPKARSIDAPSIGDSRTGVALEERVSALVLRRLGVSPNTELAGGGLGISPGWDSLRQIEILLDLEEEFGIRFTSAEVENLRTLSGIVAICASRVPEAK